METSELEDPSIYHQHVQPECHQDEVEVHHEVQYGVVLEATFGNNSANYDQNQQPHGGGQPQPYFHHQPLPGQPQPSPPYLQPLQYPPQPTPMQYPPPRPPRPVPPSPHHQVYTPPHVYTPPPIGTEAWRTGLFDCMEDPNIATVEYIRSFSLLNPDWQALRRSYDPTRSYLVIYQTRIRDPNDQASSSCHLSAGGGGPRPFASPLQKSRSGSLCVLMTRRRRRGHQRLWQHLPIDLIPYQAQSEVLFIRSIGDVESDNNSSNVKIKEEIVKAFDSEMIVKSIMIVISPWKSASREANGLAKTGEWPGLVAAGTRVAGRRQPGAARFLGVVS
ncbi:hypothetical protein ACLB2K_028889 [Fragaria x ananassa]